MSVRLNVRFYRFFLDKSSEYVDSINIILIIIILIIIIVKM